MIRVRIKLLNTATRWRGVSGATRWAGAYSLGGSNELRRGGVVVEFAGAPNGEDYVDAWASFLDERPPLVEECGELTLYGIGNEPIATGWIVFRERR